MIDIEQLDSLSDADKAQKIKAILELVTHNMFITKNDIFFLLKEAVRLAEAGAFNK